MQSRTLLRCWAVGLLAGLLSTAPTWASETVTVTGQSNIDKAQALNDALRKAVEQAGRLHIATWSTVSNHRIVQDVVKARAHGIVRSYTEIESQRSSNGVWTVKIKAEVRKDTLEATWAEVEHLMDQLGEPTIMLFFDDLRVSVGGDESSGRQLPRSPAGSQLIKVLVDAGFRVKDRPRSEVLKRKNMGDARDDDRFELFKLEDNFGADLYVEGVAIVEGPQYLKRVKLYKWKTTAWCKVYWADSGDIVHVSNVKGQPRTYRDDSESNAIKLLGSTGRALGEELKDGLIDKLARRAVEGVTIRIKIDGVEARRQFAIEDALKTIKHIETVKVVGQYDTAVRFEVKTKLLRQNLVRELMLKEFPGFKLSNPRSEGRGVTFKVEAKE